MDEGLDSGLGGGFFKLAKGLGIAGAESTDPGSGGLKLGIAGAGIDGGRGAAPAPNGRRGGAGVDVSESEWAPSIPAPVLTPPRVFRSFGIPPASKPASCGGPSRLAVESCPASLWLRARFPGAGGARPLGAFRPPGTGGAPDMGPPPPPDDFDKTAADRSLVTVLFNLAPFVMSPNSASCAISQQPASRLVTGLNAFVQVSLLRSMTYPAFCNSFGRSRRKGVSW